MKYHTSNLAFGMKYENQYYKGKWKLKALDITTNLP